LKKNRKLSKIKITEKTGNEKQELLEWRHGKRQCLHQAPREFEITLPLVLVFTA